ncbi:bifunctional 3-(3-hydroxy-phenyl)propionate/3-hydroxycinnamic acid hydroxylase [Dactylosporangium sp. NPDC005572]|uniref:bifunctional 3-(3-hydroxy-phenyl)propionate/3-hydroxycinnamic acid hydroxylase n=1 Tax=Dactylosporangium sp. NPDC005572 TaxID=3156889 RepID=UPI0033A3281F
MTVSKQVKSRDVVDVAVVGAGPTGLMIANLLGVHGLRVQVFEAGQDLIDFPRGVGMDDETLRTFQAAGLVDNVLPHTIPHQLLVFVDAKQRDLARLAPPTAEFGWPRRNGFVQPLADRVLLEGLDRFDAVDVHWNCRVTGLAQDADRVELTVTTPEGERTVRASYVVGADGGRSDTRKALGFAFAGTSAPADWFVIDIRNDPLGRPGSYVVADPHRPYVSISIPHGIRRFEFMLKPGETEAEAMTDEFVRRLLAPIVPASAKVDIIRRRVYTHHSRMAEHFRSGRVFLIGDAAHVMPVWQGQGYNSGIRDSLNLSWKLAMVLRGLASDQLLDSYETERRRHVRAMIDLSTWVGRAVSVTNRLGAAVRNGFFRTISAVPSAKSYIVTMRFKPMPTMTDGALTKVGVHSEPSPVGRMFIQPTVSTRTSPSVKLDDALGPWFALITWNNDPCAILDDDARARLARTGVRLVWARPAVQLHWTEVGPVNPDVLVIGDLDGSLKRWFDARPESVLLIRPDRIVGGAGPAHAASDMVRGFDHAVAAPDPSTWEVQ